MGFTSVIKKFLRGGDGLKGPAKTPPVLTMTRREEFMSWGEDLSGERAATRRANPRRVSKLAARTKVKMRQAKDKARHRQNVAAKRHVSRVDRTSR